MNHVMARHAMTPLLVCGVLLGVLARTADAAPAFVQANFDDGYPVTQLSVGYASPVTSGNLLVLAIRLSTPGVTVTSVTSTGGRAWTQDRHQISFLGWAFDIWSLANAPAGTTTVTSHISGTGGSIRMVIAEYSGIATSSPAIATNGATAPTGSTANPGTVVTTVDNCLLFIGVATDTDLEGFQPGPGYTIHRTYRYVDQTPLPSDKVMIEDRVAPTAGTWGGTMTMFSDTWAAILVAYRPSGGLAVSPPAAPTAVRVMP